MTSELTVRQKKTDIGVFHYADVGSGYHFKPSFRLWISSKLVQKVRSEITGKEKLVVKFPCKARIHTTEKGTKILKPDNEYTTYNVFVQCGYRGGSDFEVLEPANVEVHRYVVYESPRGAIGESRGALVVVEGQRPLKVRWYRGGRLYGGPSKGITIYYPNGKVDRFEDVEDLDELVKELE